MSTWSEQLRSASPTALLARAAGWFLAPPAEGEEADSPTRAGAAPAASCRAERASGTGYARAAPPRRLRPVSGPEARAVPRGSQGSIGARPALTLAPPLRAEPEPPLRSEPGPPPLRRELDPLPPVVAVLGLTPGAGASTIARAVAARLAVEDPCGAAILVTPDPPRTRLGTAAASRLARTLADRGTEGPRRAGRLCVVSASEPLAPIVAHGVATVIADIPHGAPAEGAVALADHVVLVCAPDIEPALAVAVESSLDGSGPAVSLVLNRAAEEPPPGLEHALAVPESRMAAQLTLACRGPRGPLAEPATELAERTLEVAWLR